MNQEQKTEKNRQKALRRQQNKFAKQARRKLTYQCHPPEKGVLEKGIRDQMELDREIESHERLLGMNAARLYHDCSNQSLALKNLCNKKFSMSNAYGSEDWEGD